MKKTKILVTGAGGFLGQYIVRDLFETNLYEITTFSRGLYPSLEKYNVLQKQGNLSSYDDVYNALEDIDYVIHTASQVGMWGTYQSFYQTNFTGTKNLIDAAKKRGIKKFIYTSTPSVAFGNTDLRNVDETIGYPKKYYSFYAETKALAEKYVLENNSEHFLTTAIRPHLIFGPGDQNLIPRVTEAAKKGKLKIVGDGENLVDVTYVENASYAHLLALSKLEINSPLCGRAYFLGQGPIKLWDFTNDILKRQGLAPVTKKIPLKLAYGIGFLIECVLRLIGKYDIHPPMTRFVAMQLGMSHHYDHHNIENDLGFKPKFTISEGLDRLFTKK